MVDNPSFPPRSSFPIPPPVPRFQIVDEKRMPTPSFMEWCQLMWAAIQGAGGLFDRVTIEENMSLRSTVATLEDKIAALEAVVNQLALAKTEGLQERIVALEATVGIQAATIEQLLTAGNNSAGADFWDFYGLVPPPQPSQPFTTAGPFTQGSVIFAGPSGILSEDNANFFWDDAGNILTVNALNVVDEVISISVTAADVTLTAAQAQHKFLIFTGTPGVARNVTFPDAERFVGVYNNSDSNITFKAGAGTSVALVPNTREILYADGATNIATALFGDTTSWTPTLIGGTTAGTQTYVQQTGQCKLLGNLVWIYGYVEISAKDVAMAGDATIGGLPFTVQASRTYGITLAIHKQVTYTGQLTLEAVAGTTTIKVVDNASASNPAFVQATGIAANTFFGFTGWYKRA